MPTSTTRQQTHRRALPHLAALESRQQRLPPRHGAPRGVEAVNLTAPGGPTSSRGAGRGPSTASSSPGVSPAAGGNAGTKHPRLTQPRVFVLDKHKRPLMPTTPRRARLLLRSGRARAHRRVPFTIRLVDRTVAESTVPGVQVKIDPGSQATGIAVARTDAAGAVHGLVALEVQHRGAQIHRRMITRAGYRRARRTRNLRHRPARFENRRRPEGWLAPSLRHRVETTLTWVIRLRALAPVTGLTVEAVRIGPRWPAVLEVARSSRCCAYCDATTVPLQRDHVHPRARGGGDRPGNRVWACTPCNRAKGTSSVEDFVSDPLRRARILAAATAPRHHATAATTTSAALLRELAATGLPLETAPGSQTRTNRVRLGIPKSHTLDALLAGDVTAVGAWPAQVLVARSMGRGTYSRTRSDRYGFPRMLLSRRKLRFGFQTGDRVRVVKPGRCAEIGRVIISASGYFTIISPAGVVRASHRRCQLLSKADGWTYTRKAEQS